jgi:hypothetical protein
VLPQGGQGQQGVTRVGAQVNCSNSPAAPEAFHAPHVTLH